MPPSLHLVRALDRALRGADHDPQAVAPDATDLALLWAGANTAVRTHAAALLARRAGDRRPAPPLESIPRDPSQGPDHLGHALALAARIYTPGQDPCGLYLIAEDADPHAHVIDARSASVALVLRDPDTGRRGGVVPGHWLIIPRVHMPSAASAPDITGQSTPPPWPATRAPTTSP